MSDTAPYSAAVVQLPLHGLNDHEAPRAIVQRNAERVARLLDRLVELSDRAPRLVVLPVLALGGIGTALRSRGITRHVDRDEVALNLADDPRLDPIREVCARHGLYVASSHVEKHPALPGHLFHTGYIIGPEGLVLRCPKTQAPTSSGITLLRDIAEEYTAAFGPDSILPVAETPIGRLACLVEGEFLIPEAVRTVAKKGAEIVCHPTAQLPGPGRPPVPAIQQTLAYLNGLYWLSSVPSAEIIEDAAERIEFQFAGGSCIIGPDGALRGHLAGPGEGHAIAEIDLGWLRRLRPEQAKHTAPAANLYRALYG
jgi:predicted amidohydrolase